MSLLANALRPYWLPGLNSVSGRVLKGVSGWLSDSDFQIHSQIQQDAFEAYVSDHDLLLESFAADINRCSMAAFESIVQIQPVQQFPKSLAWLVIKAYYSAFFAAHSLLRVFGTGFAQIDRKQARSINQIADLFGMANGISLSAGYYKCVFDIPSSTTKWAKMNPGTGGVHEAFWSIFYKCVLELSEAVLKSKHGLAKDNQVASAKLDELAANLSYSSFSGGNWLSYTRNIVNYNQRLGVWFPYSGQLEYVRLLFKNQKTWLKESSDINLSTYRDEDLGRFQQTCNFLVALCRETALEMAARCPSGNSFHFSGSIAFMNFLKQRVSI